MSPKIKCPWVLWPALEEAIEFELLLKRDPALTVQREERKVTWWGDGAMVYFEAVGKGRRSVFATRQVGET